MSSSFSNVKLKPLQGQTRICVPHNKPKPVPATTRNPFYSRTMYDLLVTADEITLKEAVMRYGEDNVRTFVEMKTK